jgi:hypothetical protein
MDNFLKLAVAVNDSKGLLSVSNVLPSLSPLKLSDLPCADPSRASQEGKLISAKKIAS